MLRISMVYHSNPNIRNEVVYSKYFNCDLILNISSHISGLINIVKITVYILFR
jgi:hypothetical protein